MAVVEAVHRTSVDVDVRGRLVRYEAVPFWPLVPHPMTFGANAASIAAGQDGLIYVFSRSQWPLMVFDSEGNLHGSWTADVLGLSKPHGIDVDAEGNIYLVDADNHVVEKRNPAGELLLRLGEHGVPARPSEGKPFNRPTDIAVDLASGDLFVSDGYGNSRVHRFDASGALIKSWGSPGSDPGQFGLPHGITLFGEHVVVADRENYRLQFFTHEGEFVRQLHVHHPLSISAGGPDTLLYVGEMGPAPIQRTVPNLGHCVSIWNTDGERVGRLGDGTPGSGPGQFFAPHGVTVDPTGNIYVAEVAAQWIGKFWGDEVPLGELRSVQKWARTSETDVTLRK